MEWYRTIMTIRGRVKSLPWKYYPTAKSKFSESIHSQELFMSSKYSDEKIKVTSYGYQRSQLQNLTVGERLEIHKSHFLLHNERRKFYIFISESEKKNVKFPSFIMQPEVGLMDF